MALQGQALGAAIQTQILAIPGINVTNTAELTAFCNAIGNAIVAYLKNSAVVSGNVTSGSGSGGQVVGTLT